MLAVKICIFIFLVSPVFSNGQEAEDDDKVRSDILLFVDSLQRKGIDTIFTHQTNAVGYDRPVLIPIGASERAIDSLICETKEAGYVFWIYRGESYVKKVHPCFNFEITSAQSFVFLNFLSGRSSILKYLPLLPFSYKDKRGRTFSTVLSHSILTKVWFQAGSFNKGAEIDSHAMSRKSIDRSATNLNYSTNRQNPFFLLSQLLEKQIKQANFRKQINVNKGD